MDGGIEAFIEKADEALYLAKKQGKNQLAVYASGTDGRLQTQTEQPLSEGLLPFLHPRRSFQKKGGTGWIWTFRIGWYIL